MTVPTPAVQSAIRILHLLKSSPEPLGVSEIARQTGLNKSTVHGIVATLAAEDLLKELPEVKRYQLGAALVELGHAVKGPDVAVARRYTNELAHEFGLPCYLASAYSDREFLILDGSDVNGGIRVTSSVGDRYPLTAGALGKAYLAWQSEDRALEIIKRVGLRRFTKTSIGDVEQFMQELAKTRKQGWGEAQEEVQADINAVAAPVFGKRGEISLLLFTFGLASQLQPPEMKRKGKRLRQVADMVSSALGGTQPRAG